jgi:hypothetical protein
MTSVTIKILSVLIIILRNVDFGLEVENGVKLFKVIEGLFVRESVLFVFIST